jgi:protein SCO1/2
MRIFIQFGLLALCLTFLLASCKSGAAVNEASPNAKRYQLKGKVISVDRTAKKAKIEHEDIEGYMDAMTMDFPIHADWVWNDLTPGSEIRADLVVDNTAKDPFYLENIGIIALPNPDQSPIAINDKFAQVGQQVPDFSLTNQDGKHISLKDFRGKALAITFIYAKCPLPDYCIRMTMNFSDLAHQIAADNDLKDKIRLLSISFDPANDTPEKLRSYGIGYLGNDPKTKFDVWQLAVGSDSEVRKIADFFGLRYEIDAQDKTKINHSLRTAVIAPDGKVVKIFPGNEWTTTQLLKELESALAGSDADKKAG